MPTFRIYKNKNYTVMSNKHLKDKRITYKAKGLLSFMLSLPEDWDYSINGLVYQGLTRIYPEPQKERWT